MQPLTILLTGCGAPGTSGTVMALRQNFDHRPVHIVGVDVNPDTPGQQLVDAFARVFPPENLDYRTRLMDVCLRHSVDVVIPQTTREVALLGHLVTWFAEEGIRVMASNAAERANNKSTCLSIATGSMPVPVCWTVGSFAQMCSAISRFDPEPVVIKPLGSSGGRGVHVIYSGDKVKEPQRMLPGLSEFLVMQYLPGLEYSVDCFRGQHVQIAVPRIRTAMRDGISTDTTIIAEPEIARHALTIAKQLGLTGVYGVQFKANAEGVPCLLEVNPRVQGTMAATVLAGANVIWMGVREVLGDPVTDVPTVRIGTRCVRHWVVSEWSDDTNMGAKT